MISSARSLNPYRPSLRLEPTEFLALSAVPHYYYVSSYYFYSNSNFDPSKKEVGLSNLFGLEVDALDGFWQYVKLPPEAAHLLNTLEIVTKSTFLSPKVVIWV